jgi:putative hydrolase of the HAD superfamily
MAGSGGYTWPISGENEVATRHSVSRSYSVTAILFDFGGVIAEEGFREGLTSIAREHGLEPEAFVRAGFELVYGVGYVLGRSNEKTFWQAVRDRTGIQGRDESLRDQILSRFTLRPWMLELLARLREAGVRLALLSDQTNWLDELDAKLHFFHYFDHVFNSYHLGKSKKDPSLFDDVLKVMDLQAGQALFVDDHGSHIERARQRGLNTILYLDQSTFMHALAVFCPFLRALAAHPRQKKSE